MGVSGLTSRTLLAFPRPPPTLVEAEAYNPILYRGSRAVLSSRTDPP